MPSLIVVAVHAMAFLLPRPYPARRTIPTGGACAVWSGVGTVLKSLICWVVFQWSLDAPALVGLGPIVAGLVVIDSLSAVAGHGGRTAVRGPDLHG